MATDSREHNRRLFNEINITPLTDIFLVLLIIMMVVAPMLDYPGLKLSVPSVGPDPETHETPKTVTVVIDAHDQYLIDNQPVSQHQLTARLRDGAEEHPDGVVIQAHPESSHNALTMAMDAVQRARISKLGVMRYEESPPPAATDVETTLE